MTPSAPPLLTGDALQEELSALLDETPGGAVLFDADGTLWADDVGHICFEFACTNGLLRHESLEALRAEARAADLPFGPDHTANELGLALLDAYLQGRYDEKAAAETMVWAYAGYAEDELRRLIHEALAYARHDSYLHRQVIRMVEFVRRRGGHAYVVSASPRIVIEESTRALGFAPNEVTGGVVDRSDEHFVARLAEPLPYGPGKVTAGKLLTGERPWLAAFGDSGFDLDLMAGARLAVGLGEKSALLAGLPHHPRAVRLSPP